MANSTFTFGAQTQLKNCLDPEDAYDLSTKNYVDNKTNFNSITIDGVTIGTGQTTLTPYSFNLPPTQGGVGGVLTLDDNLNLIWDNSEYVAPFGKDYGSAGLNIYNSTGSTNIGSLSAVTYSLVQSSLITTPGLAYQSSYTSPMKGFYIASYNDSNSVSNLVSFASTSTSFISTLSSNTLSGQSAITFNLGSVNADNKSTGNELAIVVLTERVLSGARQYMFVVVSMSATGVLTVVARTSILNTFTFENISAQILYSSTNTYQLAVIYNSATRFPVPAQGVNTISIASMTITPATSTITLGNFTTTTTTISSGTRINLDFYNTNTLVLVYLGSFYTFNTSTSTLTTNSITQPSSNDFANVTVIGTKIYLGTYGNKVYIVDSLSPFNFVILDTPFGRDTISGFAQSGSNISFLIEDSTTGYVYNIVNVPNAPISINGSSSINGASTFNSTATFNGASTFNSTSTFNSPSTFSGSSTFVATPNFQATPFTTTSGTLIKNTTTNVWNLNTIPLLARYRKVAFNVNSSTDTAIPWDTNDGNTTPFTFNASTGVITNAGSRVYLVQVFVMVGFASNGTGARVVYITKNGASTGTNRLTNDNRIAVTSDGTVITTSTVTNMAIGDTLTVYCFQASGVALQVGGATSGMATGYSTLINLIVF